MPDVGVLFSLPTESVAVRAAVGSLTALLLVSVLFRVLSVPRVRSSAALAPVIALVGAILASWSELLWPVLMTSTDGEGALPMLVRGEYIAFAPVGWPLLVIWVAYGSWKISRRLYAQRQLALVAATGGTPRDLRVHRTVNAAAARLRVPAPRAVVVDGCPGGAVVVGIRRPTIVIDAGLLAALDDEELEGLIAHELAHVRRHDNLLALLVGVVRDLCFFVPGGRWVARRLCAERELAADSMAVEVTGRPAALASGLLKVVDSRRPSAACAAFAAPATTALVARVERLCHEHADAGAGRTVVESAGVAAVLTIAIAAAFQLPASVAGTSGERDALALLWAWNAPAEPAPNVDATAFSAFRRVDAYEPVGSTGGVEVASDGSEFHPSYLRGIRSYGSAPSSEEVLRQAREARLDEELIRVWSATPVVGGDDGLGVYWLHRRQ